ncbi:MAG: DUF1579 family protein [Bryobacteraceae bacterium]|nr:DUF1579 family protein [Bryobacteraceae bacterium]
MKRMIVLYATVLVVCLAGVSLSQETKETAEPTSANHEHLKALQPFIGDWELTGEVQLANRPADPFVYQRHVAWTLGGNFIETRITEVVDGKAQLRHQTLIGWDKKAKQITEWGFWNADLPGETAAWAETVIWSKDGEKWLVDIADGVAKGVFSFIDQNTYKYECQFRGDDGSENRWHFTAKRKKVSPAAEAKSSALPAPIAKELDFFVGEWTVEGQQAGKAVTGRWSAKWSPQKECILLNASFTVDGEVSHGTGMSGWDSKAEEIVTRNFFSNGALEDIRYKLVSPGVLKGVHSASANGESFKADCEVRANQPNEWTFNSKASALSGKEQEAVSLRLGRVGNKSKRGE